MSNPLFNGSDSFPEDFEPLRVSELMELLDDQYSSPDSFAPEHQLHYRSDEESEECDTSILNKSILEEDAFYPSQPKTKTCRVTIKPNKRTDHNQSISSVLNTTILEDSTDSSAMSGVSRLQARQTTCLVNSTEDENNDSEDDTFENPFSQICRRNFSSRPTFSTRKNPLINDGLQTPLGKTALGEQHSNIFTPVTKRERTCLFQTPKWTPIYNSTKIPKENHSYTFPETSTAVKQQNSTKQECEPEQKHKHVATARGSDKPMDSTTVNNEQTIHPVSASAEEESNKYLSPITEEDEQMNQTPVIHETEKQHVQVSTQQHANIPGSNVQGEFRRLHVKQREYLVLRLLGQGGSCQVFNCLEPVTFESRAIKVVSLSVDPVSASGYVNEVKMLKALQGSEHVVRIYDYEIRNNTLYVVMEQGGIDLSVFLRNLTSKWSCLPLHVINYYWLEMLHCVREVHDAGIIHLDLKPSNFLIVDGRLKLIDFGIASRISSDMTSVIKNVQVGTFKYISPEALLDSRGGSSPVGDGKPRIKISYKSDVWSLGCILYQMVYRQTPFHNIGNTFAKIAVIMDPRHVVEYPPVEGVPPRLLDTMRLCLQYDMRRRPTVAQLMAMCHSAT